jgi:hypothetical protein
METESKKSAEKKENQTSVAEQKKKSKIMLAREKYPEGIGYIVNMRAVLR